MSERKDMYLPDSDHLLTFRRPTPVAMHIQGWGNTAEADIRQLCSGHMPQVGERYVWVCTGVAHHADEIDVQFHLVRLEDGDV